MDKVYSLEETREWFLNQRGDSVICVSNNEEKTCKSYPEAKKFFEVELKTPKEWEEITGIILIDHKGWEDVLNPKDINIEITKRQFINRAMGSYIRIHENLEINMTTLRYKIIEC